MWAFQACVFIARVNCTVNTSKLRLGKTPVCIFYLNIYEGSYMCVVSESNKYCILLYRSMLLINLLILFLIHHVVYRMSGKTTVALRAKLNNVSENTTFQKENPFAGLFTMLCFPKGVLWKAVLLCEMLCSVKCGGVLWNVVFCEVQLYFVKWSVLWTTIVFCEMLCFVKYSCVLWNVFCEVLLCSLKCFCVLCSAVLFNWNIWKAETTVLQII